MDAGMPGMPMDDSAPTVPSNDSPDRDCPWAAGGGAVSCTSLGITSILSVQPFDAPHSVRSMRSADSLIPVNLRTSGLFHPPKA